MEDDFRKLVLGKFYNKCKSKQIPVSNLFLSKRLSELQSEGYLEGCELKDLISMCEFKPVEKKCLQHVPKDIPRSISDKDYNKILKELELDDVIPSDEPLECPICLEEFDEEKNPIERLSPCGHYAHHSCIFKTSKAMGKEPFCPLCNQNIDNVKSPSYRELREGKRQLAAQYTRALVGEREGIKQDQFRTYVRSKTRITQPFINTMWLISSWNHDNPNFQIRPEEYDEYKKIASTMYKDRYNNEFDSDIDEIEVDNAGQVYDLMVENILQYLPDEIVMKMGPLEIEEIWNENSVYHINLKEYIPLYEKLNEYRIIAEKRYKVNKKFDELYRRLLDFDYDNNTDISSRVKTKYEMLRNKEDKKNIMPGYLVEKEIFNQQTL